MSMLINLILINKKKQKKLIIGILLKFNLLIILYKDKFNFNLLIKLIYYKIINLIH